MTTTAFSPRGKYQKRGQRLAIHVHQQDQVRQQPLLFVGLRNGDLVEIDPVRPAAAEEQIVRAARRLTVALLSGPCRVALARETIDRARSKVNAAAWPPWDPTLRSVTAGFAVRGRRCV